MLYKTNEPINQTFMKGCGLAILCIEVDDYISLAENAIQSYFTYDLHDCLDWQIYCNG